MAKYNVEIALIKELKKIAPENLFYEFMSIINGNYMFQNENLNKIPQNVLAVYLEKILDILRKHPTFENNQNIDDPVVAFYEALHSLKPSDLKNNKKLNKEYEKKIRKAKIEAFLNKSKKPIILGVSAGVLIAFIFFSCGKNLSENKESKNNIDIETELDEMFERENTLAFDDENKLEVEENTVTKEGDELSNKEKVAYILEEYNLSQEQFDVLCAIVISEAWVDSYEDAYAVINTIYNRTISKKWVDWIDKNVGENTGVNLYYQATFPDQFVVYQDGVYKRNMGRNDGPAYDAIIDFLMTKELKHDYLAFRANYCDVEGFKFDEKGNIYFDVLEEEDRIANNMIR